MNFKYTKWALRKAHFFYTFKTRKTNKRMITRKVNSVQEALNGITDNMTIMLGGFGLCGIPENSIAELVKLGISELTCISNNAGVDDFGIGLLLKKRMVKRLL